eukprot:7307006-Prymnesium_polylepis.1
MAITARRRKGRINTWMQEVQRKMASAEVQRQQKMVGEEQLRVQRESEIGDEIGQLWEAKETADSLTWDDGK